MCFFGGSVLGVVTLVVHILTTRFYDNMPFNRKRWFEPPERTSRSGPQPPKRGEEGAEDLPLSQYLQAALPLEARPKCNLSHNQNPGR